MSNGPLRVPKESQSNSSSHLQRLSSETTLKRRKSLMQGRLRMTTKRLKTKPTGTSSWKRPSLKTSSTSSKSSLYQSERRRSSLSKKMATTTPQSNCQTQSTDSSLSMNRKRGWRRIWQRCWRSRWCTKKYRRRKRKRSSLAWLTRRYSWTKTSLNRWACCEHCVFWEMGMS